MRAAQVVRHPVLSRENMHSACPLPPTEANLRNRWRMKLDARPRGQKDDQSRAASTSPGSRGILDPEQQHPKSVTVGSKSRVEERTKGCRPDAQAVIRLRTRPTGRHRHIQKAQEEIASSGGMQRVVLRNFQMCSRPRSSCSAAPQKMQDNVACMRPGSTANAQSVQCASLHSTRCAY